MGSIGGLLLLFSTIFWGAWNYLCMEQCGGNSMSFLESIGLISIAYVVYSAVRFAQIDEPHTVSNPLSLNTQNTQHTIINTGQCDTKSDSERTFNIPTDNSALPDHLTSKLQASGVSKQNTTLSDLSPKQREALLKEVARCCGKPYDCADSKHIGDTPVGSSSV